MPSSNEPTEHGTSWFLIGSIATIALVALVVWFLAVRYDIPLY
jgi:hypothetical protein